MAHPSSLRHTIGERLSTKRANPYVNSAADHYRGQIELASGCTITIQLRQYEPDEGGGEEWYGWANEYGRTGDGCLMSNTKASALADTEIGLLDKLAAKLRVSPINHSTDRSAA